MKRPQAIDLWSQQSGKKVFWWEPVDKDETMFRVEDTDGEQWFVMQSNGDIIQWRVVNVRSYQQSDE